MKKIILSLVVALMAVTTVFAQSSMLATLSHDDQITSYYGPSALSQAYAAAVDGDIITLSSGTFNAVNITKGITIRGAGMAIDNLAQNEPTVLTGNFDIQLPETARLTIEGIYHNQSIGFKGNTNKNITFLKDRFNRIWDSYSSNTRITNLTMVHCKVANEFSLNYADGCSVSCVNCVIGSPIGDDSNWEFVNCVVTDQTNGGYFITSLTESTFKNCLIDTRNASGSMYSSNVIYNCVGFRGTSLFNNIPNSTNTITGYDNVFTTYRGTYLDDEAFELTESAKTIFLGTDGKEVGLYGGNMPFDPTPTNPQITKCDVAAKSTADGKLSVDITVNGAQ